MKLLAATATAATLILTAQTATAGPISRACIKSDRAAASRALCGCIQNVANLTLKPRDQRLAAKFFGEPDKAQEIRMSKSDYHNAFWARYKQFGHTAQATCS
ncbi:MAG: hypothetical protein ACRBBU_12155 [Pseudooceanicola sp.]